MSVEWGYYAQLLKNKQSILLIRKDSFRLISEQEKN